VNNAGRNTRSIADPLNLRVQPARLEVRRHFFSNRVDEDWNKIPSCLECAKTMKSFKNGYAHLRLRANMGKTRDMEQAVSKSIVWTTPSHRH
jgi:hypothetical protein